MNNNEPFSQPPYGELAERAGMLLDRMFDKTIEASEIDELLAIWKRVPEVEAEAKVQFRIERLLQVSRDLKSTLPPDKLKELDVLCRRRLNLPSLEEDSDDSPVNPLPKDTEPEQLTGPPKYFKRIPPSMKKFFTKDGGLKTSHVLLFLVFLLAFCVPVYTKFFVDLHWKTEKPSEFQSIARVEAVLDVLWHDKEESFKEGQMIGTDSVRIRDGIVQLAFSSGVRIVVKGPADFRLNTHRKMFLGEGRLSATVPPEGRGFEVATPFLGVVDLGTEFFLDVRKNNVEAHTIRGKIELSGVQEKKIELIGGEALKLDTTGKVSRFEAEPSRFLTSLFVLGMREMRDEKQLDHWNTNRQRNLQIPGLRLFYDFEETDNYVVNHVHPSEVGWILGAKRCEGRWSRKKGCSFYRKNDAIGMALSRNMTSATLWTSFRLDSFSQFNHVLLGSRGTETGNFVWQIFADGSIQLAVRPETKASPVLYRTRPIFQAACRGAWYHLATVLDAPKKEIRTYLDGQLLDVSPITVAVPLHLGEATLGNWLPAKKTATASNLNGRIDQLMIFDRPLTDEEVRQISLTFSQL